MSFNSSYRPRKTRSADLHIAAASRLFHSLNTPVSLGCYLRLKYGQIVDLVSMSINPDNYTEAESFRRDYQAISYLKKYPFQGVQGLNPEETARGKFDEAERLCSDTNRRFRARSSGLFSSPDVESVLFYAQQKIERILGDVPSNILEQGRFGPGASSSCTGRRTSAQEKFRSCVDATPKALKYVQRVLDGTLWSKAQSYENRLESLKEGFLKRDVPSEVTIQDLKGSRDLPLKHVFPDGLERVRVVPYNKVVFVPKDAKTHRSIAVEPTFNGWCQLAVGSYLREKLRRVGVDLDDQRWNQDAARKGSIGNDIATIDLASASDTVAYGLVTDLLPEAWCELLGGLRSEYGMHPDGSVLRYSKWSSMGNGYTFELESMIFFALAHGCYKHLGIDPSEVIRPTVYGDDIAVDSRTVELLHEVLTYCGFKINVSKSFTTGPFRESCGEDFFLGVPVRPVFLREPLLDEISVASAANSIRRASRRWLVGIGCDAVVKPVYDWLCSLIPSYPRGPDGFGDTVLISNFDEARPSVRPARWGIQGYLFWRVLPSAVTYQTDNSIATLAAILHARERGGAVGESIPSYGKATLRDTVRYSQRRGLATTWPDLGGWF